jgi:hypothetical protein
MKLPIKISIKNTDIKNTLTSLTDNFKIGLTHIDKNLLLGIKFMNPDGTLSLEKPHDICCWWDRHKFDSDFVKIPIDIYKTNNDIIVNSEGFFCSYECCYSYIDDSKDILYKDSISLLHLLFNKQCPNKKLKKAHDWKLLQISGIGSMDIKQFRQSHIKITRTPNTIYYPIIVKYQELK